MMPIAGLSKDRIEKANATGVDLELPGDPFRRQWNELDIRSMMSQIGGLSLYDSMYRHASAWLHWNPQSMYRAVNQVSVSEVDGFTETDWGSAVYAIQAACRGLGQSLVVLDERFERGLTDVLIQIQEQLNTSMKIRTED